MLFADCGRCGGAFGLRPERGAGGWCLYCGHADYSAFPFALRMEAEGLALAERAMLELFRRRLRLDEPPPPPPPKPQRFTLEMAANLLGVSTQTARKYVERGMPLTGGFAVRKWVRENPSPPRGIRPPEVEIPPREPAPEPPPRSKRGRPPVGDLTHVELAAALGTSPGTLYGWRREGCPPFLDGARRWRDYYCRLDELGGWRLRPKSWRDEVGRPEWLDPSPEPPEPEEPAGDAVDRLLAAIGVF